MLELFISKTRIFCHKFVKHLLLICNSIQYNSYTCPTSSFHFCVHYYYFPLFEFIVPSYFSVIVIILLIYLNMHILLRYYFINTLNTKINYFPRYSYCKYRIIFLHLLFLNLIKGICYICNFYAIKHQIKSIILFRMLSFVFCFYNKVKCFSQVAYSRCIILGKINLDG